MTKSTKWFLSILALLAVAAVGFSFLVFLFVTGTSERTQLVTSGSGEKIALVQLQGVIISSDAVVRQLKKHREDKSIKAILLRIDSPGGGVVATQEMYEEVKKTRDSGKPVVASMGSVAASGGYYVACGASRVVANPGSLIGSIGVISEFFQLQEAMDKLGVGVKTIKSGKLKDAGSPTRKMTEEDQKYFQSLMDDVHEQFIRIVERERKLPYERVMALADGRVFTGVKAVEFGLVDTLGTFEEAVAITAKLGGIKGEPAIVKERKRLSFWESMFGDLAESISAVKQEVLDGPVLSYRFASPY